MLSTPMTPTRRGALPALATLAAALLLCTLSALAPAARADTVDYTAQATATLAAGVPLTIGGLTATPAAGQALTVSNRYGLGVAGANNGIIDGSLSSEAVQFSFTAGPATAVTFRAGSLYANPNATELDIEGFGADGTSLGVKQFNVIDANGYGIDVSALFGGVALSHFTILAVAGSVAGVSVGTITFTPPAPPDTAVPTVTATSDKSVLPPNNGKAVGVVVTGKVTDNAGGSGINPATVSYTVKDEYGLSEPAGGITLALDGRYSFTVYLPASRNDADRDGRTFTITVSAKDKAGNPTSKAVVVTVPHDQAKK